MNEIDQAELNTFMRGSTPEARRALGHLLRNALQPLVLHNIPDLSLSGMGRRDALSKITRLVDELTK